jgi:type IV secretion system protein TrbG
VLRRTRFALSFLLTVTAFSSSAFATVPAQPTLPESASRGEVRLVRYGDAVTVQTAVLRATGIVLNPDERLRSVSQPDGERWQVAWSEYGPEGNTVPVVTVTPSDCGISTNLLVLTTRRIYPIRLLSAPCENTGSLDPQLPFDPLVRYRYAEDELVKLIPLPPLPPAPAAPRFEASVESILNAATRYRAKALYGWRGAKPTLVTDDGKATFLVFPDGTFRGRDLPLLFLVDEKGERTLANFDVQGSTFRVLGLFEEAVLVQGKPTGPRSPQLRITRTN